MASIKVISRKLAAWRKYREAVRELSQIAITNSAISVCIGATSSSSLARPPFDRNSFKWRWPKDPAHGP